MLKKLRLRFVCITMAIATVMLCVIFGLVYHSTQTELERESLRLLELAARRPGGMPQGPQEERSELRQICFTVERTPRGEVRIGGAERYGLTEEEAADLLGRAEESGRMQGVLDDAALRFLREPAPGGERVAFIDISGERAMLKSLVRTSLLIGGASFVALFLLSLLLCRWAVGPVERAWAREKEFVADAAHELKTPLTVILTNAELLQAAPEGAPERVRYGEDILTMAGQMRNLTEGLLELARLDAQGDGADFAPVDLSRLVSDALLPFEPMFFEKGLQLQEAVSEGVSVVGSAGRLTELLDVLLDNAMKYTVPGGTVWVRLERRRRGHCLMTVANQGEEIAPEEREALFRRLYRADKARSRSGGYGLGLSIARGIVTGHGGKIWCESAQGVNSFCAELPTAGR